MKAIRTAILITAALISTHTSPPVNGQSAPAKRLSPDALVSDLYKAAKQKRSPFFQTRSRALVDKYFAKRLADLIWKDAVTSKGEVGIIDGDPLYDAQDMDIKNFLVGSPKYGKGMSEVTVSFENLGKKQEIVFLLISYDSGWKIRDIEYAEGRRLYAMLNSAYGSQVHSFEGTYRVGDTTCTVKPIKMAFEVKWAKGKGPAVFFYDTASEQSGGKRIFSSKEAKDQFIFDDDHYDWGRFVRADGTKLLVTKVTKTN